MHIRRMADGRYIARSMERRTHAKSLAQRGQFAGRCDPADGADVHADEIDQLVDDQRPPFQRMGEQFAHRKRRGGVLANHLEPLLVLRRQRVFQEEQPVGLKRLGQPHGVDRRQPFVNIVEQLGVEADRAAHMFEHGGMLRG